MLPRWLITFRALALTSAFAAAFVPIATYITDDKRDWLWIHIGVNIAAYIAVALTTIYTTISLTQQDHNKYRVPAYWSNNVVMRTWWLGVSKTWCWHVAAAVGRLGLALALAQYVHITMGAYFKFNGILNQFFYYSYNLYPYKIEIAVRSQWETVLIGFVALCGFAALETAMIAAWTLVVHFLWKRIYVILALTITRIGIIILCIALMTLGQQLTHLYQDNLTKELSTKPLSIPPSWEAYNQTSPYKQIPRGTFRTAFTWLDNGTMLSTWVMRPMTHADWNHACVEREGDSLYDDCLHYDNRPHILNDLLVALISYTTYILAILASLQLAHYPHWRREQGMIVSSTSNS